MFFNNKSIKNNHFIIAAPRSGTTWLNKMLNVHQDVNCIERRLFGDYADFILDEGNSNPRLRVTLDKYVNSMLLHHGLDQSRKQSLTKNLINGLIKEEKKSRSKKVTIDKITPYLNTSNIVLDQINNFFPKAKIIFLLRDGRDVITSGVFHWFNKIKISEDLSDFEKQRRDIFLNNNTNDLRRFFQDKEIVQWANEWKQTLEIIEKAKLHHNIKIIRYENMLENPSLILKECFSFLNVRFNQSIIDNSVRAGSFKIMSKGRELGEQKVNAHVRKGVTGDWKNYFTKDDAILFNEIAGNALIMHGYEKNLNWLDEFK
ncbi:hypothetical protein CW736_00610 [Nonlabens sp. MB-3u-79]|uniref:sulfotransferase domain-containing protein n=1 Tax=Nonlabens sp. MB-3u-79 TaxID=2058134 RepID=UPI000C30BC92|nr:sulfotransferase domain-containing protein [Nonlabens sp. MB-3u-79]AUC78003.1 hypothetical protein CW736_00610 [Nonlabens sp. MB-3u-79]